MRLPQIESPAVVMVGGVDPGGGAGLLRDLVTAAALGARAHGVETAWTEQGPGLHRVEPREPGAVRAALVEALATLRPAAVKVGMAVGPATAAAIVEALGDYGGPVVVDPVLATSRGGALWAGVPREILPLLRRATLVTPNAVEAAVLGERPLMTAGDAEATGRWLIESEQLRAVLVKGGHVDPDPGQQARTVVDILVTGSSAERFSRARTPGPSPRGTGCALASAIAVKLACRRGLSEAVREAGDWLAELIAEPVTVGGERHLSR